MKINWNKLLQALVLIKIGQDLGTYSKSSVAIHDLVELIAAFVSSFTNM